MTSAVDSKSTDSWELVRLLVCPRDLGGLEVEGEYLRCLQCGSHFPVEDEIPNFTGQAVLLDDQTERGSVKVGVASTLRQFDGAHRLVLRFINAHLELSDHDVLLDVGGGAGTWSMPLSRHVSTLIFLDPELGGYSNLRQVQARLATRVDRLLVVKASGEGIPLVADSVDKIICTEVLEHVPKREAVLAEIARVLKPGGRAFISTTPDPVFIATYRWRVRGVLSRVLPSRLTRRTYLARGFDAFQAEIGHIHQTSIEDLTAMCEAAGLHVRATLSMHKRAGMWFEELRWALPVASIVLTAVTLPIYWREGRSLRRGLSPHVVVEKPST